MKSVARSLRLLSRPAILRRPQWVTRVQFAFSYDKESDIEKLKRDSKAFYEKSVQRVHEMENVTEWATLVEESEEPVVLDIYADWSEPCKRLTPILEKAANAEGDWKLVKINIDRVPEIATQFSIKQVPTVILVSNKQFIDAFNGYPDETVLNRFFSNVRKGIDGGFLESKQKENAHMMKLDQVRNALMSHEFSKAEDIMTTLLKEEVLMEYQPIVYLMMAHAQIEQNKTSLYQQTVKTLKDKFSSELESDNPNLQFMKDYLRDLDSMYQGRKQQPVQDAEPRDLKLDMESDPNNLQTKFRLAEWYINNNFHQKAAVILLQIIKADKNWKDKRANNQLLELFKTMGSSSDLTVKYRKLYQRLLY